MKTILVIDEPMCCDDCPLMFENDCGVMQIHMQLKYGELYYPKPTWCPLKPLPDKIDQGYPCSVYDEGYGDGWDGCIDEILGEENETSRTEI